MAKQIAPGLGLGYGWTLGESGPSVKAGLDTNFLTTSVLLNLSVKSRVTALPTSAASGSVYIVPAGASSNANRVAARTGSTWTYFTPKRNWEARVEDEADAKIVFDSTNWVTPSAGGSSTTAALTEVFTSAANTATDQDFLSLTVPLGELRAGLVLEAAFYGTHGQAASAQDLTFYAKVNDGAAVPIGLVSTGTVAQSERPIHGKAIVSLLSIGSSGTYTLGGEFVVNGLLPDSATSATARAVNTSTGFKVTLGVRTSVANAANREKVAGAYIKRVV